MAAEVDVLARALTDLNVVARGELKLKPEQEVAVKSPLGGKDVLAVLPTTALISPTLSSLPYSEKRFSNDALPPPVVKFTPQNLLLLFFYNVYLWVFFLRFTHNVRCYFTRSLVKSVMQKSARLFLISY